MAPPTPPKSTSSERATYISFSALTDKSPDTDAVSYTSLSDLESPQVQGKGRRGSLFLQYFHKLTQFFTKCLKDKGIDPQKITREISFHSTGSSREENFWLGNHAWHLDPHTFLLTSQKGQSIKLHEIAQKLSSSISNPQSLARQKDPLLPYKELYHTLYGTSEISLGLPAEKELQQELEEKKLSSTLNTIKEELTTLKKSFYRRLYHLLAKTFPSLFSSPMDKIDEQIGAIGIILRFPAEQKERNRRAANQKERDREEHRRAAKIIVSGKGFSSFSSTSSSKSSWEE